MKNARFLLLGARYAKQKRHTQQRAGKCNFAECFLCYKKTSAPYQNEVTAVKRKGSGSDSKDGKAAG